MKKRGFKGGFLTIIGVVLAIAIVCILFYFVAKTYLMQPKGLDEQTAQGLHEQNIDTTNYRTIMDSTRKTVGDLNKLQQDRIKQLKDMY